MRNRILASPRFQRTAARLPLVRWIARRRARALFDLVAGFTYSQILLACVRLGLIEMLAAGPMPLDAIAARTELPRDRAERLLKAAAALRLVEPLGDGWALGADGAALRGNRGIVDMIAHHPLLYADLADPVALLRRERGGGALAGYWRYAGTAGQETAGQATAGQATGDEVAAYSRLMAASQPLVAGQILDAYRFARHRRLLDVGGGQGTFLAAVGARVPALQRTLFDLPAVVARARPDSGLRRVGGDFFADPLPTGHDLITLVRVLHDHDDAAALSLLRAVHAALPRGGRLLIAEPMAGTAGAQPAGDAYFGLYLLAMGSGAPRTPREIARLLHAAGFASSRLLGTALPITVRAILALR